MPFGRHAVDFSHDDRRLASAGYDGLLRIWDTADGTELAALSGHTGTVHGLAFAPDDQFLISGGSDGTVRFWDTRSLSEVGQDAMIYRVLYEAQASHKECSHYHDFSEVEWQYAT